MNKWFISVIIGLAAPAFAQQPQQREPSASEVMAAMKAVEGQRDYAQAQAQNANVAAQRLGEQLQAEVVRLTKLCGDPCKPPKQPADK